MKTRNAKKQACRRCSRNTTHRHESYGFVCCGHCEDTLSPRQARDVAKRNS